MFKTQVNIAGTFYSGNTLKYLAKKEKQKIKRNLSIKDGGNDLKISKTVLI